MHTTDVLIIGGSVIGRGGGVIVRAIAYFLRKKQCNYSVDRHVTYSVHVVSKRAYKSRPYTS